MSVVEDYMKILRRAEVAEAQRDALSKDHAELVPQLLAAEARVAEIEAALKFACRGLKDARFVPAAYAKCRAVLGEK